MEKKILNSKEALDFLIREFGTLMRAFNPAARAYQGYVFAKKLIFYNNEVLRAWVAWDYNKENAAIVAEDASLIDLCDYNDLIICEDNTTGAKELFQMFFPTLYSLFNPADRSHSVDGFIEGEEGYIAIDRERKNKFVVPLFGGVPYVCDVS